MEINGNHLRHAALNSSSLAAGLATISAVFDFCVTARGELLATKSLYKLTYKRPANGTETNGSREPRELVIFERQGGRRLKEAPARPRSMERKVEGCVDLTQVPTLCERRCRVSSGAKSIENHGKQSQKQGEKAGKTAQNHPKSMKIQEVPWKTVKLS